MESSMDGGALNYTNEAEGTVKRMTDAEAQAVIELWAQRRKAEEVEATMPSAKELSEALNVPQAEVEALLLEVRGPGTPKSSISTSHQTGASKAIKSRNLAWTIAILSLILFCAFYAYAMLTMKPNIATVAPSPTPVAVTADTTTVADTPLDQPLPTSDVPTGVYVASQPQKMILPPNLKVEFDGQTLQGAKMFNMSQYDDLELKQTVETSIRLFVAEVGAVPLGGENLKIDSQNLVSALLNDKSEYSGFFIWRPLTISVGKNVTGVQIPICVNVQDRVKEAVKLEQDRRIAKAASQAVEMVRGRYQGR